jgi:hypothetical protein
MDLNSEKYLSNKHVILSSPGVSYVDNYYSHMNSSTSLVECTYSMGKYNQSLSSLSFGSTSNVSIPNESFLGEVYLNLVLPPLSQNVSLPRGWGYNCINQLSFIFGSSNTSTLSISGQTLWTTICAQCKSSEKRNEFFRLGGDAFLPAAGFVDTQNHYATILLQLPFSTACDKLDFDSSLLTNNIVVTVSLNNASSIFGGTGTKPTSLLSAKMTFRQGDFSNRNNSLRNSLLANPDLMYSYPMIHNQSFNSPVFQGVTAGNGQCQVNLQGFINSDLLNITFYVVKKNNVTPVNNSTPNMFLCDNITNISLNYNGIPLYVCDGNSWKVVNMVGEQESSYFSNIEIASGNIAPFSSQPYNSYMTYINFSRVQSACWQGNHVANTFRISNQTLNLYFNTTTTDDYILYATYMYSGMIECKNGNSFIYFD